MATPRIYTAQALSKGLELALEPGASRHFAGVLRLQKDDAIVLFDGNGGEYSAQIEQLDRKHVVVRVTQHHAVERESPLSIHLGIAISRGDRFDWVVQKATGLGATHISPLISERVEVKLKGERADKKLRHWQQIAISACEQCGRNKVPPVHSIQALASWAAAAEDDCRLVLHHRSGLSAAEIEGAQQHGFSPLTLGPRILRTETAPLAALVIVQQLWGDVA